jgi:hypothetical protein
MTTNKTSTNKISTDKTSAITITPFEKMTNVSNELDFDDYKFALTYHDGLFLGFVIVIHMNEKYPRYHNLMYAVAPPDNMLMFTEKGWKPCIFENILEQLKKEVRDCLRYVRKNGKQMLEEIERLQKIGT